MIQHIQLSTADGTLSVEPCGLYRADPVAFKGLSPFPVQIHVGTSCGCVVGASPFAVATTPEVATIHEVKIDTATGNIEVIGHDPSAQIAVIFAVDDGIEPQEETPHGDYGSTV